MCVISKTKWLWNKYCESKPFLCEACLSLRKLVLVSFIFQSIWEGGLISGPLMVQRPFTGGNISGVSGLYLPLIYHEVWIRLIDGAFVQKHFRSQFDLASLLLKDCKAGVVGAKINQGSNFFYQAWLVNWPMEKRLVCRSSLQTWTRTILYQEFKVKLKLCTENKVYKQVQLAGLGARDIETMIGFRELGQRQ